MGTREELAPVWKAFAIQPQQDNLEHSAHTILADAERHAADRLPL